MAMMNGIHSLRRVGGGGDMQKQSQVARGTCCLDGSIQQRLRRVSGCDGREGGCELRYMPATSMAKSNEINPEECEGGNEWT